MKDNKLTVLTQMAVPAESINLESARAEYAEATAEKPADEKSLADRQRRLHAAPCRISPPPSNPQSIRKLLSFSREWYFCLVPPSFD